ncbi:glycosyltransferase family 4 protein [Rhodocytophaga aerolata]|uniref:Glycosyltransferase family 4 protein n=1 Tax=Rhodocytophaga aerolata TaxID=455078 RepID=A0ABT8RK65_9BACT|nr:glycosyltransferase family 4 protein [Rhodocytophaga aerolata]MDO1451435.1 glycosyltransferase family 4 protein [Rhodocytophaga aerolata]
MKIALVNTFHFSGGAAVACHRLMYALQKNGVEASMLVQELNFPDKNVVEAQPGYIGRKKALLRFAADRFYFLLHEKNKEVRFAFSPANIGTDISRHPMIQQADVIHLHWINFGFLSLQSLKKLIGLNKPIVWTLHDMWAFTGGCHYSGTCTHYQTHCHTCPFLKSPHPRDLSYSVFEQKLALLHKANITFVTCSQWLGSLAGKSTLLQHFPIHAIPNPIDTTVYTPISKQQAREALQLPSGKKLILFGAFKIADPRKGFIYLEEALHVLKQAYPARTDDIGLLLFGKTDPELLKKDLAYPQYHLGKLSSTEKLVQVYNAADVFVLPSLEDNLPNTVMESMACGTPTVAFHTGGVPEMISHGQNGYLASYQSAADLAQGIYQILFSADPNELSKQARQQVLTNFNETLVAQKYSQLYTQLLS